MTSTKKRMGRPPARTTRPRSTMSFRISAEARAALKARAEENGRSMSEQLEHDLEEYDRWLEAFAWRDLLINQAENFAQIIRQLRANHTGENHHNATA